MGTMEDGEGTPQGDAEWIRQSTISEWKKNHTNPSSEKIMVICNVLGVTPEWLLSGTDTDGGYRKKNDWFVVDRISEVGLLIESYNQLDMKSRKRVPTLGVRKLVLPQGLMIRSLHNSNFPDLEEMEFSGLQSTYVFSDGMFFDCMGKRLLLSFKRGIVSDEIRIPAKIKEIGSEAFWDTGVRKITFANPDIDLIGNPFERCVWFDEHKEAGKAVYTGNMVFRHFSSDELVLDHSIKRISRDCFKDGCPERITTHFIPDEEIITALDKGGCKKITITSDCIIP